MASSVSRNGPAGRSRANSGSDLDAEAARRHAVARAPDQIRDVVRRLGDQRAAGLGHPVVERVENTPGGGDGRTWSGCGTGPTKTTEQLGALAGLDGKAQLMGSLFVGARSGGGGARGDDLGGGLTGGKRALPRIGASSAPSLRMGDLTRRPRAGGVAGGAVGAARTWRAGGENWFPVHAYRITHGSRGDPANPALHAGYAETSWIGEGDGAHPLAIVLVVVGFRGAEVTLELPTAEVSDRRHVEQERDRRRTLTAPGLRGVERDDEVDRRGPETRSSSPTLTSVNAQPCFITKPIPAAIVTSASNSVPALENRPPPPNAPAKFMRPNRATKAPVTTMRRDCSELTRSW